MKQSILGLFYSPKQIACLALAVQILLTDKQWKNT